MNDMILTLFSSDATLQYTKDIFSVLSLPRNCIFQFRYQTQYVENSAKAIFENEKNGAGTRVLISFRSSSQEEENNYFIVPIRWAKIVEVKHFSDVYTVYLELQGYPQFTNSFLGKSSQFKQINEYAKNIFYKDNEHAVLPSCLDIVELNDNNERDTENWRIIVESLINIPKYARNYFLKCSPLYEEQIFRGKHKRKLCKMIDGNFIVTDGKVANIDIEYYSAQYDSTCKQKIGVVYDEKTMRLVKGTRIVLQSRYGTTALRFQSLKVPNNTISEVIICSESGLENNIQTDISMSVIIKKDKFSRFRNVLMMSIGAALVALPGILGNNVNIAWNIILGILGVVALGVNQFIESKSD